MYSYQAYDIWGSGKRNVTNSRKIIKDYLSINNQEPHLP